MHTFSQPDPPPDAPDYAHHVRCEHDGLSQNFSSRRKISIEAHSLLKMLFPQWETLSTNLQPCIVCDAMVHVSKEDKRELRRKAEEEKAKLKHMHDNALSGNTRLLEDVPCAILPATFIRCWRQWLLRPAEAPRPDRLDNSQFICEHDMLVLDPNTSADFDCNVALVRKTDWDILEHLYSAGPFISLENQSYTDEFGAVRCRFVHEPAVCPDCREKRKANFEEAAVTVRLLGPKDDPSECTLSRDQVKDVKRPSQPAAILGTRGIRQSKRLRQVKVSGERRRVMITKSTTLKDIKLKLQDEFGVPTICQRLFHHSVELQDNSATVMTMGILSNDLLDLREVLEDESNLNSDAEGGNDAKRRRDEGRGFGGTLLAGSATSDDGVSDGLQSRGSTPLNKEAQPCPVCTFDNTLDASICSVCDAQL
ncbi:hypothetical protein JAAARDRAFT_204773 [Jaapia argillacea MUCL 33604]|uniref:Ubiquitin-like domain-containing protein n=1 Tax=Jaapia argillacea MUCL 33604 TaxID=933084 RepID=A0A067Q223_9AGAM|nr:hypothetical protein JAAARDRAFT_204773 [Jaapia argillacea MUCL 33604]